MGDLEGCEPGLPGLVAHSKAQHQAPVVCVLRAVALLALVRAVVVLRAVQNNLSVNTAAQDARTYVYDFLVAIRCCARLVHRVVLADEHDGGLDGKVRALLLVAQIVVLQHSKQTNI